MTGQVALARRYQQQYLRLRRHATDGVLADWSRLGGLDDTSADAFARAAAERAAVAALAVAGLVEAYVSAARTLADLSDEADPADPADLDRLRGIDPEGQYRRPVVTARTAVADGFPFEQAMARAADRAASIIGTDVLLAQRVAIGHATGTVGYRRVLTGESCALCATASTQRYHRGDLMPIHARCDCSVAPIIGDADPGRVINQERLDAIRTDTTRPDYWRDRHFVVTDDDRILTPPIAVRQHGELGPVLTVAGHAHTGPSNIPST